MPSACDSDGPFRTTTSLGLNEMRAILQPISTTITKKTKLKHIINILPNEKYEIQLFKFVKKIKTI